MKFVFTFVEWTTLRIRTAPWDTLGRLRCPYRPSRSPIRSPWGAEHGEAAARCHSGTYYELLVGTKQSPTGPYGGMSQPICIRNWSSATGATARWALYDLDGRYMTPMGSMWPPYTPLELLKGFLRHPRTSSYVLTWL